SVACAALTRLPSSQDPSSARRNAYTVAGPLAVPGFITSTSASLIATELPNWSWAKSGREEATSSKVAVEMVPNVRVIFVGPVEIQYLIRGSEI
ncbi:MAG: hypothetical protein IH877_09495, partial [Gemmatimonadetes bacterium]|nr:hypothetical protein [Gemmatimonadota bacterium]